MNLTITSLEDSGYNPNGTGEYFLKSVNNNLLSLYTILKKYEGVYFDSVDYQLDHRFRDEYAYKAVTTSYSAVHDDEEIYYRDETSAEDLYPNNWISSPTKYTVVADSATPSSSQIRISDVTPCPDVVSVGDKVFRLTRRPLIACANMDYGGRYEILCKFENLTLSIMQYRSYYNNNSQDNYTKPWEGMFEPTDAGNSKSVCRGVRYSVYNKNITPVNRISNAWSSSGTGITYWKCRAYSVAELDNAVAISFAESETSGSNQHTYIGGYDLVITKSKKGKTVILSPKEIMLIYSVNNSSYSTKYPESSRRLTATISDTVIPSYFDTNSYTYDNYEYHEKTILQNIPCCGVTDDYVENVFVVPFTQYKFANRSSNTIIDINGTQFFYTGFFAIRG